MLTRGFQISSPVNLETDSKELADLKEVIQSDSSEDKELEEDEKILNKTFHILLKSTSRGSVSFTQGEPADEHATNSQQELLPTKYPTDNVYFQQSSQSETTITKYKGDYILETKTDSKTYISYPYYKEYDFTSRYTINFCGCFIRGDKY